MSRPVSAPARRTYFNNPLIGESLRHLPEAVNHPTSVAFRNFLIEHLHHNSQGTRARFAQYISQRYSRDGAMNLDLARAIARWGEERTGREILYFELLQATPILSETAALWLAEQPPSGAPRSALLEFVARRLLGKSAGQVAKAMVQAFRECGKLTSPKPAVYLPVWSAPPIEAFLYVLARLYPERTMVRLDLFLGEPILRALLWPRPAVEGLLAAACSAGHLSRISELDQVRQFTLDGTGAERMNRLLGEAGGVEKAIPKPPPKRRRLRCASQGQMALFPGAPPAGRTDRKD